jgi:hypothetical protein
MNTQVIKAGEGYLWGISNSHDQKGKVLRVYDGPTILLAIIELDNAFPDREAIDDDTGETLIRPGIVLDVAFTSELRTETNGDALTFYWR